MVWITNVIAKAFTKANNTSLDDFLIAPHKSLSPLQESLLATAESTDTDDVVIHNLKVTKGIHSL